MSYLFSETPTFKEPSKKKGKKVKKRRGKKRKGEESDEEITFSRPTVDTSIGELPEVRKHVEWSDIILIKFSTSI